MMLQMAVAELDKQLEALEQGFDNIVWAVVQGQVGVSERHAVMEDCAARAQDWLDLVQEARVVLVQWQNTHQSAYKGTNERGADVESLCGVLTLCQERYNRLCALYYDTAMAGRRLAAFGQLKREGGSGAEWVRGAEDALGRCSPALSDVPAAFLVAWQRLVAGASIMSVSVNTYAIGVEVQRASGRSKAD